jgi:hypothetical protein
MQALMHKNEKNIIQLLINNGAIYNLEEIKKLHDDNNNYQKRNVTIYY